MMTQRTYRFSARTTTAANDRKRRDGWTATAAEVEEFVRAFAHGRYAELMGVAL